MKVHTNENNTNTLKLLIAAKLSGKHLQLVKATVGDGKLPGPRRLPILEVDNQLSFFSSNAAVLYLLPELDLAESGKCQQLLEWEATRLYPAVSAVLSSKVPPSDLKQALQALLQSLDSMLGNNQYLLGGMLTAADISIWSTLYPIYCSELRGVYVTGGEVLRWGDALATNAVLQEALKQWGGSPAGPFGATASLGAPQLASLLSHVESPDESDTPVTPEELETAKDCWLNGISYLQDPLPKETVKVPIKGRRNVLITSSLPYVNNVPHLGNIIGCVLSADIFARFCRQCGHNTLYICGTDEYGTATETKALEEGVTPREICDKYNSIHAAIYRWFDIEFDYFGRTSSPQHTEVAQHLFKKLHDNGFVSTQAVDQLLCEKCNRFLADRFVEGTCPHVGCGYDSARGDQCDKCGKLINATELIQPRCKVCGHPPVMRKSEQFFLELGQLEPSIRTWVKESFDAWSPPARAVVRSWLREPLRARAVTRDLKWGVSVPIKGYEHKVLYVWFEATMGYISITKCLTDQYEKWWKPEKEYDVKLYQFMAKDNVLFHGFLFPGSLLGVNEGHILVNHLYATEYLNYEEGKFSKSRGVGVFGTDAQDTGIPADVWRFYLASIRPETSDSSFSWQELGTRNNSELLNNLGNFCHRSLSFCANSFGGKVPATVLRPEDYELIAMVNRDVSAYVQHLERGRLREALRHVLAASKRGNQLMQASQPWVLLKGEPTDRERGSTVIGLCCQLVSLLCVLIAPYMPQTARRLTKQLNMGAFMLRINSLKPAWIQYLPPGHCIGKPEPLFTKLEPSRLEELRVKYAGTQNDRAKQNGEVKANGVEASVAELEAAITAQGERVRQLKASTKDKSVWTPEVNKLLELKKQLQAAQAKPSAGKDSLEKAVAEQGEKVRKLKASTKDKTVWLPEVNKLLELKKQLANLQI